MYIYLLTSTEKKLKFNKLIFNIIYSYNVHV